MHRGLAILFLIIAFSFAQPVAAGQLHDAARTGDRETARQLLDKGAKIDEGDGEDMSALYHAAAQNHTDIVRLLLSRGADPNRIRVGSNGPIDAPIHVAVKRGNLDVIRALADGGADLTLATYYAQAPLHVALQRDQTEAAELLRSLGAANFKAPSVTSMLATADVERGRKMATTCNNCHAMEDGGKPTGGYGSTFGPTLWNIVGRKRGSVAGWDYSEALRSLGGVWTYEYLNNFIANPTASAPGTKKWYFNGRREARAAIIAYLRTLSDKPVALP